MLSWPSLHFVVWSLLAACLNTILKSVAKLNINIIFCDHGKDKN